MFTERFLRDKKGASPTPDERNRLEAAVSEIRALQPRRMPRPRCRRSDGDDDRSVETRAGVSVLV
jgi:hypothetical protein